MTVPAGRRYDELDGLRGVASLLVVFHHGLLFYDYALYSGAPDQSRNGWDLGVASLPLTPGGWGGLAISVFFVLSGFVLAHSLAKTRLDWAALVAKRYVRLTLPILAACVIAWAILALFEGNYLRFLAYMPASNLAESVLPAPNLPSAVGQALTAMFTYRPHPTNYDGVLWTMPIEFAGSLILITIYAVSNWRPLRRFEHRRLIIGMLTIFTLANYQCYLGLFGIGALLNHLAPHGIRRLAGWPQIVGLLAVGLILGTTPHNPAPWPVFGLMQAAYRPLWSIRWVMDWAAFWHGIGATLIVVAVLSSAALRTLFSSAVPKWLGQVSYPLYLIHAPLVPVFYCGTFVLLRDHGWSEPAATVAAILALAGSALVFAQLLTIAVERPTIALSGTVGRRLDAIGPWGNARRKSHAS
jgi:peptidoglycan/LPS O-acetylase OafA/YrhL